MSTPAHDYARAAVEALSDALRSEGTASQELLDILTKAIEERSGTLLVTITTPLGDSGTLKDAVQKAIEKKTGKKVTIRDAADKALIGGVIISYGDERIDLSISRALQDAKYLFVSS